MKKLTATLMLLSLYAGATAQYKKASFFEKEGRTYGLGTRLNALGDGKGSPLGFYFSWGKDVGTKRWFRWWEIQVIPQYDFKFAAISTHEYDQTVKPVTVTGRAKGQVILGHNWGYRLIKDESGDAPKIQPYLTTGFNLVILGGRDVHDRGEMYTTTDPTVVGQALSAGITAGAGTIVNLNSWFGLTVSAGYTLQGNMEIDGETKGKKYYMYTSHPYASVGLRFRIAED